MVLRTWSFASLFKKETQLPGLLVSLPRIPASPFGCPDDLWTPSGMGVIPLAPSFLLWRPGECRPAEGQISWGGCHRVPHRPVVYGLVLKSRWGICPLLKIKNLQVQHMRQQWSLYYKWTQTARRKDLLNFPCLQLHIRIC